MTVSETIDYCLNHAADEFTVVRDITLAGHEIRAVGKRLYVSPTIYDALAARHHHEILN
jgi:hypothetical protein